MGLDFFLEGSIAWLCTVDSAMQEEGIQQIITNLNANEDLSAQCMPCLRGTYGVSNGQVSIDSCIDCEAGKSTTVTGGDSIAVCEACPVGTYGAGAGHQCVNCEAGTYSDANGSTVCQDCPENTDSPEASTTSDACMCNLGTEPRFVTIQCSGDCPCPEGPHFNAGEIRSQTGSLYGYDLT